MLPVRGMLWYNIVNQQIVLSDSLFREKVNHAHNTRFAHNEGLVVPKCTNKYGERTLQYLVPTIFNKLPMSIKNVSKYTTKVKFNLKKWLLDTGEL